MHVEPGTRLGPYQVVAGIGAGGMGEVYRARDTSLERDVAIKVLPEAFASDPDRLMRFEREARVLASLNHPNIAAIYGLETSSDTRALVLELVDGPTLADRVAQGPIPVDDALSIARQIAEALEAAHEQRIVHCDLKSANIKLRPDGAVKVLDFGLARALGDEQASTDQAISRTISAAAIHMGGVMGTAAYMSPEQVRGLPIDKRADIWAFGIIVYEMLTGERAFPGDDVSQTLARVIDGEPNWDALPKNLHPTLVTYLRRCLQKDPRQRVRDIGDVRLAMDGMFEPEKPARTDQTAAAVIWPAFWRHPAGSAILATLVAVGVTGIVMRGLTPPVLAPTTRMAIVLPQNQQATGTERRSVAVSPNGTHVVYAANFQLYLRAIDVLEARPVTGTEASAPTMPFFSPDGQWIGFYSTRDSALKKVAISGGAAATLAETDNPYGASWGPDDTIVFGQGGQGILRVPGQGGTPEVLVSVVPPARAHQPQLLPGGEAILFTLSSGTGLWDTAQIVVEHLATGERTVLVNGGSDAHYLPTGHLVYVLGGTLLAVAFDVDRLSVKGVPVPVVDGINRSDRTGAANIDIARTGTLVYLPGDGHGGVVRSVVWVDREGREETLATPPRDYGYPRLSPDGARMAINANDEESDIWVWDFSRETLTRLTFSAETDAYGIWTPDGQRIAFQSRRDGAPNLYWRAADGTGEIERLTESSNTHTPYAVSPDGTHLLFRIGSPDTGEDLYVLTVDERRVEPLIVTEFDERNAELSPDGRWVAYQSNASGQFEIYVQPFPNVNDGRWLISATGGTRPLWGRSGRELFYLTESGVMGVPVGTGEGFEAGTPRLVVDGAYYGTQGGGIGRTYDVSLDGQRFLLLRDSTRTNTDDLFGGLTQIAVVLNWSQELLERVPPVP